MCGIAGSFDRDLAFDLYQKNLERGRFSAGLLTVRDSWARCSPFNVTKTELPFTKDAVPAGEGLYLFHSRAPTSRTLEYRPEDTHPFECGGIFVAHNGIITNAKELAKSYNIDFSLPGTSSVDSYVIPYLLNANRKLGSWKDVIVQTLGQLKGTFGLWIYIQEDNHTLICRSGSTLYGSFTTGAFSSSPHPDLTMLKEGSLYSVHSYGIKEEASFQTKPMYYIAP